MSEKWEIEDAYLKIVIAGFHREQAMTADDVVGAGFANNSDDALAAMTLVVERDIGFWVEVDGVQAVEVPGDE